MTAAVACRAEWWVCLGIVLASISVSPCSMMPFIYPGIIVEVKSRCCYFLFDDGRHCEL